MDYLIGVQEAQRIKRACTLNCEDEDVAAKLCMKIDDAMHERWTCDAHYFQYHLEDPEEMPGVAKTVLPLLRDQGEDLLMDVVSVDIDTDPHGALTKAGLECLLKLLADLFQADAGLPQPSFFYTTKGGARLVWKLAESVPVDTAEPHIKGLIARLTEHFPAGCGFAVDQSCWDWTRVFRLPRVIRDGDATWDHHLFIYEEHDEERLDLKTITPHGRASSTPVAGITFDLPQPTPEEVERLLYSKLGGRTRLTEWTKEAKHRLKGRECAPICFDSEVLPEGNRDSGIQQMVGQACGLLAHLPLATPERLYALFYDSVSRLAPDEQTEDWTLILWAAVLKYWGKEQARLRQAKKAEHKAERRKQTKMERVIEGMQSWCDHPMLHNEDEAVRELFASQHLIVADAHEYYIMQPNGYFHPVGTMKPAEVPALVRRYKMDDLIILTEMDGNTSKDVSFTRIFARHGTKVCSRPIAKLEISGYHIKDVDGPEATLMIDLYRRKDDLYKHAEFYPEVDRWLRHLVAPADYPTLECWIAYALAFDEGPTAALSLAGPPGIGKQLFIQGLAECINTEDFATAREFGRFREKLLHTPFLIVNEGLPRGQEGVEDVADIFRHFVSGDPLHIEVKNKSPITIYNPLRIIFTANNTDVILQLAGHRSLTKEDQAALVKRLVHIQAREEAANYLLGLGGRAYTGTEKHWVAGPEGGSHYVVAKHLMWIYKNRKQQYPRGDRFLMEGNQHAEFMDVMRTETGIAPMVIEAIINLIEMKKYPATVRGLCIEDGKVFVTNEAVQKKLKESSTVISYKLRELRKTISGLMSRPDVVVGRKRNVHGKNIVAHWKELDIGLLLREAQRIGLPFDKLHDLADKRLKNEVSDELKVRFLNEEEAKDFPFPNR